MSTSPAFGITPRPVRARDLEVGRRYLWTGYLGAARVVTYEGRRTRHGYQPGWIFTCAEMVSPESPRGRILIEGAAALQGISELPEGVAS